MHVVSKALQGATIHIDLVTVHLKGVSLHYFTEYGGSEIADSSDKPK
jgi:hypothetical protein